MKLKRKLFFFGLGNIRTGLSQTYKGLTDLSLRRGNVQHMTGAQRRASVMSGMKNLAKGGIKFTAGVGGTALLASGLAIKGIHDAATDG
jgi:hypothetical protein